MTNKFILFFLIFLFWNFPYNSNSEEFKLKSNLINIENNGDLVTASGEVEITTDKDLIINSDKSILEKSKSFLKASGNVEIFDKINDIEMYANQVEYNKNKEIIFIPGNSKTIFSKNYILETANLYYDRNNMIIYSNEKSIVFDNSNNKIKFENFRLNLKENIVNVKNLNLFDSNKNELVLESAALNLKTREIIGKDIKFYFNKNTFNNKENDPRLFGRASTYSKNETTIKKGVFTTCKIRENQKCPPWVIKADEVKHNKIKKTIEYKNAWLNIYDKPVLYFPYFFHPDPTIKRQSGFLLPSINNSNFLGTSIQIPYYNVISDNKDFTISPRIFFNDKILLQSEYRQVGKNSKTTIDHSFARSDESTVSHFFSNTVSELDNGELELNLETTSKNNYLKKYLLKSPLIDSYTSLNSYLSYKTSNYEKRSSFSTSIEVFEDTTKQSTDSYEYIYPNYLFNKKFETNLNGEFEFDTSGFQRKYDTNKYDALIVNNLIFNSNENFSKKGYINDYSFLIKNVNTDGENSSNYNNDNEYKLLSQLIYNIKYPLSKKNNDSNSYLTPKLSFRYSPTETQNEKDDEIRVDYFNLFNLDRFDQNDMVEGGESISLGFDYKLEKEDSNANINFSAGQVFRLTENQDIPTSSSLGQKRSDIIGDLEISPSDIFNFKYSFNVDNDVKELNYNFIETDLSLNKFTTSFKYLQSNKVISEKSYISNITKFDLNKNNSISFESNKNLDINLTEYYDLVYEYKNDCLTAAIEYKKTYYKDSDILPDENIFFTIKILPFGKVSSPTLN